DHLSHEIPELKEFELDLDSYSFDPLMDSSNMSPAAWVKIAGLVEDRYEDFDGFVILHGTDTMPYTASALSFMFENLGKPVILTGSQLPIGMIRTDGQENVITAIEIAAAQKDGVPIVPEVCIYFENQLFRGNRTHKFNAEHFEAFKSVNYPPLAEAGVHIRYNLSAIQPPSDQEFRVFKNLDSNIAVLKLFPGISRNYMDSILGITGLKAVIMETYGTGNAPGDEWFTESLQQAMEAGIIVFNITQCRGGAVEMGKYATSYPLHKIGVIGGGDITVEAAVTKLMYLLGNGYSPQKVKKYLASPLRGEMTR
ncbi:MAG: type I asparaginase, partial [Planctomycetota bacterium]